MSRQKYVDVFGVNVKMEIHDCPTCHMKYAAPVEFFQRMNETNGTWYCPQGHSVIYTKSELSRTQEQLDKERKRLEYERQRSARLANEAAIHERSARAYKGHLTRTKNRVGKGICPCCNRHFKNLERHMATKHPEYAQPPRESGEGESDG